MCISKCIAFSWNSFIWISHSLLISYRLNIFWSKNVSKDMSLHWRSMSNDRISFQPLSMECPYIEISFIEWYISIASIAYYLFLIDFKSHWIGSWKTGIQCRVAKNCHQLELDRVNDVKKYKCVWCHLKLYDRIYSLNCKSEIAWFVINYKVKYDFHP